MTSNYVAREWHVASQMRRSATILGKSIETMTSLEITREAWLRNQERFQSVAAGRWTWPFEKSAYENRTPEVSTAEQKELSILVGHFETKQRGSSAQMITAAIGEKTPLTRLVVPLCDILDILGSYGANRLMALRVLLQETHRHQKTYWSWTREHWLELICSNSESFQHAHHASSQTRQYLIAACYLITDCVDFRPLRVNLVSLASTIFGEVSVQTATRRIAEAMRRGGKSPSAHFPQLMAQILLAHHCPLLNAIQYDTLEALYTTGISAAHQTECVHISSALVRLHILKHPLERVSRRTRQSPQKKKPPIPAKKDTPPSDIPSVWLELCQRWRNEGSPDLTPATRRTYYHYLLKVGRWVQQEHPNAGDPSMWTDDLTEECIRMVQNMRVGEWTNSEKQKRWVGQQGRLLTKGTRNHYLRVLSIFFQDCIRNRWIQPAFDPSRFFPSTPLPGRAQITSEDLLSQ